MSEKVDHVQLVATALRDLSLAVHLWEQNPTEAHRRAVIGNADKAEDALGLFVEREGDVRPPADWVVDLPASGSSGVSGSFGHTAMGQRLRASMAKHPAMT